MNLLSFLPCRRPLRVLAAPPSAVTVAGAPDEEVPVHGCGWFDSSHDLHEGLCVQEHSSADSLVRELPLAGWLEWQLADWRVTSAA